MTFIPLMSPNLTDEDIAAAVEVFRSGMLVQGVRVDEFERAVAEYLGVRHGVAASNGTATLHLALKSLGVGPGDEIIVPALSHVATANVVEWTGASCVFVDVDLATFNLDVSRIEEAITERTRGIIPVHEFGLACDIGAVIELAREHDLWVIEDAACALGARVGGKCVGGFGVAGSFSLHPRKAITSGEGGFLTTDDDDLASRWRALRNHGIETQNSGKQEFVDAGFNYRLTDFQAALVLSQFRRLDDNLCSKRRLAAVYLSELAEVSELRLPAPGEPGSHTWQTFHVVLDERYDRDQVIERLRSRGIATNYGAQCIPAVSYYRRKYGLDDRRSFPNAAAAYENGLALPIYEKLTEDDVRTVARTLREVLAA